MPKGTMTIDEFLAARKKKHKYNAKATVVDGIRFGSKKEARVYDSLKLLKEAGEIEYFHMQVPIQLPGNVKYKVDFEVFWAKGSKCFEGERGVSYIDVKGWDKKLKKFKMTKDYIMKKKMVEDLYPIEIEEV